MCVIVTIVDTVGGKFTIPISILPILSKVFEKEVFRQIYQHFNVNLLLSKFQSGFRPGYSTLSILI